MFTFKKAIATTVSVVAVSILMNAPKANAARVYTTVSEYGDSAVAPGYFGGEDLDNSGSLTVAELTEYSLSFTGNSQVAAFNFGLEDILVSDPSRLPSGQYVYGNSLIDSSKSH
ncbi:hypothetical protein LC653_36420 [Nostoc sp. CHAB 5784]|uniref:hypothetical protein n=1 Tax=Nostoc mirabile TaxID=2907820 RepID=UPI001E5AAD06|nr:hypothetical protein [Nostoc mirabile]MCC5669187.1 hypothetical protein [Nostoc mirabile CHAB5784]